MIRKLRPAGTINVQRNGSMVIEAVKCPAGRACVIVEGLVGTWCPRFYGLAGRMIGCANEGGPIDEQVR